MLLSITQLLPQPWAICRALGLSLSMLLLVREGAHDCSSLPCNHVPETSNAHARKYARVMDAICSPVLLLMQTEVTPKLVPQSTHPYFSAAPISEQLLHADQDLPSHTHIQYFIQHHTRLQCPKRAAYSVNAYSQLLNSKIGYCTALGPCSTRRHMTPNQLVRVCSLQQALQAPDTHIYYHPRQRSVPILS